eukprot:EG_transcript_46759
MNAAVVNDEVISCIVMQYINDRLWSWDMVDICKIPPLIEVPTHSRTHTHTYKTYTLVHAHTGTKWVESCSAALLRKLSRPVAHEPWANRRQSILRDCWSRSPTTMF